MDLKTAEKTVKKLMKQDWYINGTIYNINKLGWSFKGFDRSTRRLGVCYGGVTKRQIGLSKKMTELRTIEEVEQTIRHEIGHAIDFIIRGHSAHDYKWKNIARQCGYTGERTTKVSSNVQLSAYKYVAFCETHGVIGGFTRKVKDNKICRLCSTKVEILPSNDEKVLNFKR